MSGPKLTAMLIFGTLGFVFAVLFTISLDQTIGAIISGSVVAALTCMFIYFAKTGKQGFARGFLSLGAVFIIVPFAVLIGVGEQIAESAATAIQPGQMLTEDETASLMLSTIFASAGLIFGVIVGLILVMVGGLMHRPHAT